MEQISALPDGLSFFVPNLHSATILTVHRRCFVRFLFFATLSLLLSSCGRSNKPNLATRIRTADTAQYCHEPDACFNPVILAIENGYEVATFRGSKPNNIHVPAGGLACYLESLPMQAWPRGPSIILTRSDDVIDEKAIERNLEEARRLFQALGLEVQFRPGG